MPTHRVVIIGGGFGGLYAARSLRCAPVQITLIDRRNFHLFQPLLYQVATGGLSPANIASPLRLVLKRQANVQVLLAEATDFDLENRRAILSDGEVPYDSLIVAAGGRHHYFGHDEWERLAPGLKTIEDATEIRRRVFLAFEIAERETDPQLRRAWLTFVVVGAGPTGVELAGALAEIARDTLRREFRSINPADAQIVLIETSSRALSYFPGRLPERAASDLEKLGAKLRLKTIVTDLRPGVVIVEEGERTETINTRTVLWAAGVQASPLGIRLGRAAGLEVDRVARVPVEADCSVRGHAEVFVIGDLANFAQGGAPLPGVAQVAMQQGRYVARLIQSRLRGQVLPPFRYRDYGTMVTIGRSRAVAAIGRLRFGGLLAWILWLTVHLMNLVQFQNRVLVFVQWAWYYFTWNRGARLITDRGRLSLWETAGVEVDGGATPASHTTLPAKP